MKHDIAERIRAIFEELVAHYETYKRCNLSIYLRPGQASLAGQFLFVLVCRIAAKCHKSRR